MDHNNKRDMTYEFFEQAKKMMHNSRMNEDRTITPDNTFQIAHKANRELLFEIIKKGHLPGSTILGEENLIKLYNLALEGKSCIILSEHLSNMDVPSLFTRCYDSNNSLLKEIFEKMIFIAGVKLNENPVVKMFTEMFTRIVIFPIKTLEKIQGKEEYKEQVELAKKINLKSTRKIGELRNQGYIFVMYPAGTRYREWDISTKKGIKETASYLNSFDYFCVCAINGNNMPPKEHEDMTREPFLKDVVIFTFGEVMNTKEYIAKITNSQNKFDPEDKEAIKQLIVDNIMNDIEMLHNSTEEYRKQFLTY